MPYVLPDSSDTYTLSSKISAMFPEPPKKINFGKGAKYEEDTRDPLQYPRVLISCSSNFHDASLIHLKRIWFFIIPQFPEKQEFQIGNTTVGQTRAKFETVDVAREGNRKHLVAIPAANCKSHCWLTFWKFIRIYSYCRSNLHNEPPPLQIYIYIYIYYIRIIYLYTLFRCRKTKAKHLDSAIVLAFEVFKLDLGWTVWARMLATVDCLELKVPQLRTFCWIFVLKNTGNVFGSAQQPRILARKTRMKYTFLRLANPFR